MSSCRVPWIILGLFLVALAVAGCKRGAGSSASPSGPAAGAGTAGEQADPLVGMWKADVQGQLPPDLANMVDMLRTNTINLHADHTFRSMYADSGGYSGTWNSDGKTVTLAKGRYEKDRFPASRTLKIDGNRLLDANDAYTIAYTELPAVDAAAVKSSVADFLAVKDDATFKAKFYDKPVEVAGIVHSIDGFTGIVMLRDAGDAASTSYLQCYLANYGDYGKLANGQAVTLRGIAVGDADSPAIEDCQIASSGPSMAVALTAAGLANEFAKDPDAAMQKYAPDSGPKTIFLTGPLFARSRGDDPVPHLFLGTDAAKVDCTFSADDIKRIASLKVGDEVHVGGDLTNDGSKTAGLENCYLIQTN